MAIPLGFHFGEGETVRSTDRILSLPARFVLGRVGVAQDCVDFVIGDQAVGGMLVLAAPGVAEPGDPSPGLGTDSEEGPVEVTDVVGGLGIVGRQLVWCVRRQCHGTVTQVGRDSAPFTRTRTGISRPESRPAGRRTAMVSAAVTRN